MTIAATRSGKIEGVDVDGVAVFKGIPYAAPPVGARRWLAPQREELWDGVRDATKFSAQSAQGPFAMNAMMGGAQPDVSEDSLYLNVWTPACDDARRPVMVWIHGGAFIFGSGDTPWYDGTKFCRHGDVVVVTINYRLGPFGYLQLADLFGAEFEGSGNAAVLDHVAALEWVRDCIANFGGDPDNVTVFGESAGGGSVGTLLATPAAQGLFAKAIAQSGASSWWATRETATEIARNFVDKLDVRPGDVDALRAVSMQQLIETSMQLGSLSVGHLNFQPIVDGTVLPQPPLDALAAGSARGVHVMAGTNRHEMTLFNFLDPEFADVDDVRTGTRLAPWHPHAAQVVADYRAHISDATGPELWTEVATDALFRMPAIWLAQTQSQHAPVWMYLFTWESPAFGGVLRSTHALEIPFVFDNLDKPGTDVFTGDGADRQRIADAMHPAWIAFARTGDPSASSLPAWPAYDRERRSTMRFDLRPELMEDPMREARVAWGDHRR